MPLASSAARVRGWAGKTTGSSSALSPRRCGRDAARRAFASRWIVEHGVRRAPSRAARARASASRATARRARSRRRPSRRRPPRRGRRRPRAASCARERSSGQRRSCASRSVSMRLRSSGIERSPLRRPASTCASGMPCSDAASAPRERRVRVAVDERPVGPLVDVAPEGARAASPGVGGSQIERVPRLFEPELLEEHLRELAVVVLPGVQHDLLDSPLAERRRSGRGLDELGPVSDHGEDLHRRGYTTRRLGPLAQLVEQGTLNPKVEGSIPSRPIENGVSFAVTAWLHETRSRFNLRTCAPLGPLRRKMGRMAHGQEYPKSGSLDQWGRCGGAWGQDAKTGLSSGQLRSWLGPTLYSRSKSGSVSTRRRGEAGSRRRARPGPGRAAGRSRRPLSTSSDLVVRHRSPLSASEV